MASHADSGGTEAMTSTGESGAEEAKPVPEFKDPAVCRIFISSPFNGLEEEREELTKRHWPRIQTLCASRGIQLRIVDMRWGITHHASGLAQTALICLKELDRSDIMVGFFGQVLRIFIEQESLEMVWKRVQIVYLPLH